jgi:hypothetical protein
MRVAFLAVNGHAILQLHLPASASRMRSHTRVGNTAARTLAAPSQPDNGLAEPFDRV